MPKGIPASGSRKGRQRHHNGQLIRTKPTSRRNGQVARFYLSHGGSSDVLRARLDGRSTLGKQYREALAAMRAHLGGDLTAPQAELANQAVRLGLLSNLAWGEILKADGIVKDGKPQPAVDVFLRAAKSQRDLLVTLGIERHAKPLNLSDYLQGRAMHEPA